MGFLLAWRVEILIRAWRFPYKRLKCRAIWPQNYIRIVKLQGILQNYWEVGNKNLPLLLIICLFFLNLVPISAFAETGDDELDAIIDQSRELQLAKQPAWLNLLHYKSTLFGDYESQVDDPDFFLAENGEVDAKAELEADLRGFFSHKTSAHPRCMFPARFYWLDKQLNLSDKLPSIVCQPFIEWKQRINATGITLLYPGMHMDSLALLFGHTLIRFDRPDNDLNNSYTLSYAAPYAEADSVLTYSWKGITGGYPGQFYLRKYGTIFHEYSEVEQRDIWEYKLNLNQQEIDQFLRHYWEVRNMHFDYYFFRENCSFRLLAMLDVARENINMSQDVHPFYAIPVDTVRDVAAAGLIEERKYYPSAYNRILQMTEQTGQNALQVTHNMVKNKRIDDEEIKIFPINKQAQILQLAEEYIKQDITPSIEKSDLQINILGARSHLAFDVQDPVFTFNATAPEKAHLSARWQLSAGHLKVNDYSLNQKSTDEFYDIEFRPSFHDLLDPSAGFIQGSETSMLETRFRWIPKKEKLSLDRLKVFSLQAIAPVKPWVSPLSKKISFIFKQRNISLDEQFTELEMQYSLGYSTELKDVLIYALAKTQFEYAKSLKDNHGFYLGLDSGMIWALNYAMFSGQIAFNYQLLEQISGESSDIQRFKLGVQLNLFKDHAIRLTYEETEYDTFEVTEGKLNYLIYF